MPVPPFRAKQPTSTTGTGAVTTTSAAADFRSWAAAFGAVPRAVRRIISRLGVWEVSYGNFDGANGHARSTVVASSNGGSLVSLGAGDSDVFFDFLPGDRVHYAITGATTLTLADIGNFVRCTPSADMVLTLPAAATVPDGMGFLIKNDGTNSAIVSIDPNGSELLEGSATPFPLFGGEAMEIFAVGSGWRAGMRPSGWRLVGRASAISAAAVDFVLPHYPGAARSQYRVDFRQVRPAVDGATLMLRTDDAGGASFDAGASDYTRSQGVVNGASTWSGGSTTDNAIHLSTDIDSTAGASQVHGYAQINPGASGARAPTVFGQSLTLGNGAVYAGPMLLVFAGRRESAADINAIRFLMSSGNIALGDFDLFACFD